MSEIDGAGPDTEQHEHASNIYDEEDDADDEIYGAMPLGTSDLDIREHWNSDDNQGSDSQDGDETLGQGQDSEEEVLEISPDQDSDEVQEVQPEFLRQINRSTVHDLPATSNVSIPELDMFDVAALEGTYALRYTGVKLADTETLQ